MRKPKFFWLSLFTALVVLCACGPALSKDGEYWKTEEIQAGMKGYILAPIQGGKPIEVKARVIGKFLVGGKPAVFIRTEPRPEFSGTSGVSGMSGSPFYIKGRLAGGYAYNYENGVINQGGVTPFEEMKKEFESFLGTHPGLRPVSPEARRSQLRPGDLVAITAMVGDVQVQRRGTVTAVQDGLVYVIAHHADEDVSPFPGVMAEPAYRSKPLTVVAGQNRSFIVPDFSDSVKLRDPGLAEALMVFNGAFGVYGILGRQARMIPAAIHVKSETNLGGSAERVLRSWIAPSLEITEMVKALIGRAAEDFSDLSNVNHPIHVIGFSLNVFLTGEEPLSIQNCFIHDRRHDAIDAVNEAAGELLDGLLSAVPADKMESIQMDLNMVQGNHLVITGLEAVRIDQNSARLLISLTGREPGDEVKRVDVLVPVVDGANRIRVSGADSEIRKEDWSRLPFPELVLAVKRRSRLQSRIHVEISCGKGLLSNYLDFFPAVIVGEKICDLP